jgi:hypothetical protein
MQLLVSPRDIEEAKRALAADIIDVKKPSEGSLGANYPWVIKEVKSLSSRPVSAAIGDFDFKPGGASLAAYGAAHAGADYIKVGLMFDGEDKAIDLIGAVVKAVKDEFPEKKVVIAAYSDFERVRAISPFVMAPLAAQAGADIAMVDTAIKDGASTFAFMNSSSLSLFTDFCRDLGMQTAIAGALTFADLPALKHIAPDIIGVRGMVCGGDRMATIQEDLVAEAVRMVR